MTDLSLDQPTHPDFALSFRPDVVVQAEGGDGLRILHPWAACRVGGLPSSAASLLEAMAHRPVATAAVLDNPSASRVVERLPALMCHSVADTAGRVLATAIPMSAGARLQPGPTVEAGSVVRLKRFSYLHVGDNGSCPQLESPLSLHRVALHDSRAAALAGALGSGGPASRALAAVPDVPRAGGRSLIDLLVAAGMAEVAPGDGPEADPSPMALWDFHDLVFHARCRSGRHDHPFGAEYRHASTHRPVPAVPPRRPGPVIELARPTWDRVLDADPKLTEVIETRRSVRDYGDRPISVEQLGELLYRAARVRRIVPADPHAGFSYDLTDRPFPTGGGSGELELYLTVAECSGLQPGAYHYDATGHRLEHVAARPGECQALLANAHWATGGNAHPQVLVTITSRFGRLSWKYSSIAYALTLKHVGVLYQTLYLVATAMGLAPCGLGSGDVELASRIFGLEWTVESAVGEFLLATRAASPGPPPGAYADVTDR
jgi:SagB-type dehydrogenase family enzyme